MLPSSIGIEPLKRFPETESEKSIKIFETETEQRHEEKFKIQNSKKQKTKNNKHTI
jgi:hypothetical protein